MGLRRKNKKIFRTVLPSQLRDIFDSGMFVILKQRDPWGRKVFLFRTGNYSRPRPNCKLILSTFDLPCTALRHKNIFVTYNFFSTLERGFNIRRPTHCSHIFNPGRISGIRRNGEKWRRLRRRSGHPWI